MKLFAAVSAAALALTGASALADHHKDGEKEMSLEEKFNKADTDSDGSISEAEFLAAFEEKVAMKQEKGEWTDWTQEDIEAKANKYFDEMGGLDGSVNLQEMEEYYEAKKEEMKDKKDKDWDKKDKDMDDDDSMDDSDDEM